MKKQLSRLLLTIKKFFYSRKIKNEIDFYKNCHNVHELPEIFHYWSNKYLLPKQKQFGFYSPDDLFITYCQKYCESNNKVKNIRILSIGSGNGELEIKIAKELYQSSIGNFLIECMDINTEMQKRTISLAKKNGVEESIKLLQEDFNNWTPDKDNDYDIIIANQSLHHVLELEHLFSSIYKGLKKDGFFITSDMIGRNGHMRWPEALKVLKPFWQKLPKPYKYNQLLKRQEKQYINHDCSTEGFEGIRAQDILALLVKKFQFKLFIPFANIVMVFIDRPFGHHFDVSNIKDTNFIDKVQQKDEELILSGVLKPTQMLAVMTKAEVTKTKLLHPNLTPENCVRKPSITQTIQAILARYGINSLKPYKYLILAIATIWTLLFLPIAYTMTKNTGFNLFGTALGTLGNALLLTAIYFVSNRWFSRPTIILTLVLLFSFFLIRTTFSLVYDFSGRGFASEFFAHVSLQSFLIGFNDYWYVFVLAIPLLLFIGVKTIRLLQKQHTVSLKLNTLLIVSAIALISFNQAHITEFNLYKAWGKYSTSMINIDTKAISLLDPFKLTEELPLRKHKIKVVEKEKN